MKTKIYNISLIILLFLATLVAQSQTNKNNSNKLSKTTAQTDVLSVIGNAVLNNEASQIDLSGEIIDTKGSNIIERGFVYSIFEDDPTTSDSKIVIESDEATFSFQLENLATNTIYYIRSYAINASGTSYGSLISIDTSTFSNINVDLKARIKTYPNPSTNYISLSGLAESKSYIIYNMQGKEVSRGTVSNNNKIDVRFLENGLYLLKLENLEIVKFIKE